MSRRRRLALAIAGVAAVAGIGCSVEKNYKLLSFFFDGVPEPRSDDESATGRRDLLGGAADATMVSAHQAYAQRRCAECHGGSSRFGFFASGFVGLDAGVCVQCHADVVAMQPMVHGPVAVGACLWCHQPHESPYASLLVKPSPDVCLSCHELQLRGATPTPGHEQPPVDCLTCHRPHGGADRYFLHAPPPAARTPPGEAEP